MTIKKDTTLGPGKVPAVKPAVKQQAKKLAVPENVTLVFTDITKGKPAFEADGSSLNKSKELLLQLDSGSVVTGFVYEFSRDQLPAGKKGDLVYSNHYGTKISGVIGWSNLPG